MNEVHFETMTDAQQAAEVPAMMSALNLEGEPVAGTDPSHFPLTIRPLLAEPSRAGLIVLFLYRDGPVGYALLIPYWSNEFGGTLWFIDELFVLPQARSRGIARQFFAFLAASRPFRAVALALEVDPTNERAKNLYESIGFERRPYSTLTYGCLLNKAANMSERRIEAVRTKRRNRDSP